MDLPDNCDRYLDRLPLSAERRANLSKQLAAAGDAPMATLHQALAGAAGAGAATDLANPAYASVAARLQLAFTQAPITGQAEPAGPHQMADISTDDSGRARIAIAPPLQRTPIVAHPWGTLNPLVRWIETANKQFDLRPRAKQRRHKKPARSTELPQPEPLPVAEVDSHDQHKSKSRGNLRRIVLLLLMLAQTAMATYFMSAVLPYHGDKPLELVTLGLFALLFCWVSAGFWTAMAGFLVLMRGTDRYVISREEAARGRSRPAPGRRS
ncbi:glucans biosynthesis glucosyltransferase H domain protein [Collimonas fungivorans]|uniref:Glucans biosynthesis glucosyltransferase H domain protein n=1 Tax=Collimonas fungivorans TaxID=158899 RepID=A0A127P9J4_9BURK|nr:glucans biosynthesis glucosyltransferase H domain protein [Collimonas fungivorans]